MNPQECKILVTGASGFIGSFLVEKALALGFETWAAVRPASSRRYLTDPRIRFVELDLEDDSRLRQQLSDHVGRNGAWDYVIHAAGATKCRRAEDFFRINTGGTERLARLLVATAALRRRFVFISSLSVFGDVCGSNMQRVITGTDTPRPDTAYGRSKLEAERWLARTEGLKDYVVLRPTGVYGPRERDYFLMARSISRHVDFAVGRERQILTFIYVHDLVEAVFLALEKGRSGQAYFLTDGHVYSSRTFSDLLQAELGVRTVFHFTAPLWVLRAVCLVAGRVAALLGKTSTLNTDKYNIMKQRNWQCDISPACRELGYRPVWPLEAGVPEAVAWYKKEKWI